MPSPTETTWHEYAASGVIPTNAADVKREATVADTEPPDEEQVTVKLAGRGSLVGGVQLTVMPGVHVVLADACTPEGGNGCDGMIGTGTG